MSKDFEIKNRQEEAASRMRMLDESIELEKSLNYGIVKHVYAIATEIKDNQVRFLKKLNNPIRFYSYYRSEFPRTDTINRFLQITLEEYGIKSNMVRDAYGSFWIEVYVDVK